MYPAFDWSAGSGPSWITARVRSHHRTGLNWAIWVTMMRTDAGIHADQARGHIGKACFRPDHATTSAEARLRHDHRAQRRGISSYRYQCRLRQSDSVLSQPWRAPCLGGPGQLIAGGAGARPDHPITGLAAAGLRRTKSKEY